MMIALRLLVFAAGATMVLITLSSAVRTFVLPRSATDALVNAVFAAVRALFWPWTHAARSYEARDRAMALFAPLALLALPPFWYLLITIGYAAIYWALAPGPWRDALRLSGSSLLTLGFAAADDLPRLLFVFSEAIIGLILVALLIAYLPTMYSAFARRERMVELLEVRAGSPPSAGEMLERYHRLRQLDELHALWAQWEEWFVDLEESHTSLTALVYFRSPEPHRSWVTAAGTILDCASLVASTLDVPRDSNAELCIRAGYIALRRIATTFGVPYNAAPQPGDPISVTRGEFDALYARLAAAGVPLKSDRAQAWRDFAGWRVNYDTVLLALTAITMAPLAEWSSDRSLLPTARRRGRR